MSNMSEIKLEGAHEHPLQDQVWEEIHHNWKKSYPNIPEENHDIVGNFLNNFFVKLFAATNTEKAIRYGHSRKNLFKSPLQMSIEHPAPYWTQDPKTTLLSWGHSEKYIEKTGAEHSADVVAAIKAAGVDEDELRAYVENYQRHSSEEQTVRLLLPVYVKLREMGYTHEDLRISS
jgi:hypothetical protein